MYSDANAVSLLQKYSEIDQKESQFRKFLQTYNSQSSQNRLLQERVLLEKEQLEQFKQHYKRIHLQNGTLDINPDDIDYYLEKNFILHRYAGNYSYISMQSVHHLFNHYQLLLTRNFEDIPLSLQLNHSLKPYLANQYIHSIHSQENLVNDIVEKNPERIAEVAALLSDYIHYQKGLVRPEYMLTQETINKPTVYQKKISV